MPSSYTLIATASAGGSSVSALSFTSIPATYTDLKIVCSLRSVNSSWQGTGIRFNSSSTNYTDLYLQSTGSATAATGINVNSNASIYPGAIPGATQTANFSNTEIYIANYTASAAKSVSLKNATSFTTSLAFAELVRGTWNDNSAITAIDIFCTGSVNMAAFSIAYLYGITKS